jgi:archaellum component FlaC
VAGLASRYTETMTIDERLEKLAERHEALAQTVELINVDLQTLKTLAQQDGENIRALARIAEIRSRC